MFDPRASADGQACTCGAVAGTFVMLDFPPAQPGRRQNRPVVYSESLTGALYLDRHGRDRSLRRGVGEPRCTWPSMRQQSRQLINKIIGEVHHG